jgi:hypothetical protein
VGGVEGGEAAAAAESYIYIFVLLRPLNKDNTRGTRQYLERAGGKAAPGA